MSRDIPVDLLNYLNTHSGVVVRQLLWITARKIDTGILESIGVWSGEDHEQFIIDGETRTYYGSGQFVQWGNLVLESGLTIRRLTAKVSPITPEMELVIRGYYTRLAPVQVHLNFYDTETNNLIVAPQLIYKGWINKFSISTPSKGGNASGSLEMVGHTRLLTKQLGQKRSNETQRKRSALDAFFNDVAISGSVITPWGSQ